MLLERAILDLIIKHDDLNSVILLLCGDLNARTGVKNNYFGAEIMDVTTVILDESCQSQDKVIYSFGRSLLSFCSGLDFGILNDCTLGNRPTDKTRRPTCQFTVTVWWIILLSRKNNFIL